MNSKTVVSAIVALSLAASSAAFAQGNGNRDRDDRGRNDQARRDDRGHDERAPGRSGFPGRGHEQDRHEGRGAGPDHAWYRGDRLPVEYRNRYYVVDDWRGHRLDAPPRGYHWVQSGGDYILVAIATGVILNLLLDH